MALRPTDAVAKLGIRDFFYIDSAYINFFIDAVNIMIGLTKAFSSRLFKTCSVSCRSDTTYQSIADMAVTMSR